MHYIPGTSEAQRDGETDGETWKRIKFGGHGRTQHKGEHGIEWSIIVEQSHQYLFLI